MSHPTPKDHCMRPGFYRVWAPAPNKICYSRAPLTIRQPRALAACSLRCIIRSRMKIIRRPRVYLVGRPSLDEAELARFLKDHDVAHWATDTSVPAEILPEVAGRVCYMSFAKPRPGGNEAYVEHIKEVKYGSAWKHNVFRSVRVGGVFLLPARDAGR